MHKSVIRLAILLQFCLATAAFAEDDTTLVPIDETEAPASDLIYQGNAIDQDQAAALKKSGIDISSLDPSPNDMWGKPSISTPAALPPDGATVDYDSSLAGFGHEISIHRVIQGDLAFRLDVSTVPHRALLTRALLNRLGYNQYAPQRYKSLTLRFRSLDDRQGFLDAVSLDTIKDPKTWITDLPPAGPTGQAQLTLQDVILEPGRVDIQNFYWAALPSDFSEGRRALRALLVPISLCDAPENIDSYHWDFARILNNSLNVPYPHEIEQQRPFDSTTIDDMRWAARRLAALTLDDWKAIVAAAVYPADIAELVLQKILARRNQLLSSLSLDAAPLPYTTHLNNPSVQDGQVVKASFAGYASRFSYGDADDPLKLSELGNLFLMQGIASGLDTLAGEINQRMVIAGIDQYAQQHANDLTQDLIQHLVKHPDQPYTQPISSWGGPIGGFSINATRQVSTGSFYGSDAAIQLVDTVGVSGSVGYFRGIDGIRNVIPGLQAELALSRNYSHLRSVKSIGDAVKAPAADFIVPKLVHDLSILLNPPPAAPASDPSALLAGYNQAVQDLLSHIADGEMFTITDSLTGGVNANVRVPVQALFPAVPVGYNESISFGTGVQGMILRRTTISRVHNDLTRDNYLQIYVQTLDSVTGNLTLDFNFWLNIAHFGVEKSKGVARTRVYTIQNDAVPTDDSAKSLATSLQSLLASNSDSKLRSNYPFYLLNHDLSESDWQFRFLMFQTKDLEERHSLRIQPPADPAHPFNPKDFERSFYSYRMLDRSGSNSMSLLANVVSSATGGIGMLDAAGGGNPAYSLFGKAHWTEVYTDAELTSGKDFEPVSILRESWAGWSISRRALFAIFDKIDQTLTGLKQFGLNLSPIHRDVFAATQKLEFYNVTSNVIFYPQGMDRIVAALEPEPGPFVRKWTDWLTGRDKFTVSDLVAVGVLRSWFPDQQSFDDAVCGNPHDNFDAYGGNHYDCMNSWLKSVMDLRRGRPGDSPTGREALIDWQTRFLNALVKHVPLASLLKVAQKDGFFLQIKVSGFRKGDHEAKDSEREEVIASYTSDSIGTADQFAGAGAFATLADQTKITNYEVNGMFFSGGE